MDSSTRQKPPPVCRRLRSKGTPGIRYEAVVHWDSGFESTATFWCVATGESVGPDDDFAHPHVCGEARACFRLPEVDPAEEPPLLD
ncbi:hypothetical protein HPC49_13040 [Pyxidicoccus fallax]|uniref:Uncharacterized protein n=1 Tax=Pyxidicoccus fallax TaxID=394095 RepID=A0A848LLR9_9BACT|nr:hypothetical protein [Pyxidicoccus fallax]NMO18620.1 hypothetical protein [Pyxidicoccus fallax]NPC79161.1 hypothetical protein [Pyxidicoccus fallax]